MAEIVDKKPNLEPSAHSPHGRSKVPFSNSVAGTHRFGEITPHYVAEVMDGDDWPLRSSADTRTFNLKAPLQGVVHRHKNYFQVPYEAILPLNWDKITTNPVRGDDVNAALCNCVIENFPQALKNLHTSVKNQLTSIYNSADSSTYIPTIKLLLAYMVVFEQILSRGSLASSLNIHLNPIAQYNYGASDVANVDKAFRDFWPMFQALIRNIQGAQWQINGRYYEVYFSSVISNDETYPYISFSRFVSLVRDYPFVDDLTGSVGGIFPGDLTALVNIFNGIKINVPSSDWYLNVRRLLAYQLVCAEFYTNDKIDYIYSANLYRQSFQSALSNISTINVASSFSYNGIDLFYDTFSGYFLNQIFNNVHVGTDFFYVAHALRMIFGFNLSLRYLDYFTGAKSWPLAVGNVNVSLNTATTVNVIDITQNIQRQRFFNFVNRVGRKFEEYTAKLFGHYVAPDWHNPKLLAHVSDVVYGNEVENNTVVPSTDNSSDYQNTTISTLRSNSNKFAFSAEFDRWSVVIGLTHYDIERFYTKTIERQNFEVDRFDMYNPFMQTIGDQDIMKVELDSGRTPGPFGYQLRHSEYKTRTNYAFGGFISDALPGWEFLADVFDYARNNSSTIITEDYIRSHPSEFDYFFLSLTSFALCDYFHFIEITTNISEPVRPMLYSPEIL